jgi:hypothetical protein
LFNEVPEKPRRDLVQINAFEKRLAAGFRQSLYRLHRKYYLGSLDSDEAAEHGHLVGDVPGSVVGSDMLEVIS